MNTYNQNSRTRRKVKTGFNGVGTLDWIKTTPYGTYKHGLSQKDLDYKSLIKHAEINGIGKSYATKKLKTIISAIKARAYDIFSK